jgi:hypothetical protein
VGQTTNFSVRKDRHRTNCYNEKGDKYNLKVYQFIRANGGWNNWSMVEIEKFTCTDSYEAKKRERYWIETLNATLNCQTPSRTKSEWILANKEQIAEYKKIYDLANKEQIAEYKKIYDLSNKEQIAKNQKIYNEANKEQIAEQNKIYALANKEKIAEYQKMYKEANKKKISENNKNNYLANREHLKERFDCPCGLSYSRHHKERHFKTKKHTAYLANIQSPPLAI